MEKKLIRKAYDPPFKVVKIPNPGPGRTKTEFKDRCDINIIMKNFAQTGLVSHVQKKPGTYGTPTHVDFQTGMEMIAAANSNFELLPADLRFKFNNSAAEFLAYMEDEKNEVEAIELGLLPPKEQEEEPPTKEGSPLIPDKNQIPLPDPSEVSATPVPSPG